MPRQETGQPRLLSRFPAMLVGLMAACSVTLTASAQPPPVPVVRVLRVEGTIGPIAADYLGRELLRAQKAGDALVVLELDTPGGLDAAMRRMVQDILASPVPVACYVAPEGARAASAGVFILMSSHVAAMAPATNVGAAHPVNMGGKMDETMTEKVTNDAVAYLKGLARQRGRNEEWAEKVVRESVSVPAQEALELGVIDTIARDRSELLAFCDGDTVTVAGGRERVMSTAGATLVERHMGWRYRFLQRITDPTIAYLLLLLGFYGLFFELSNPGAILPGLVGAACLLIAFLAFQSLPVNYVGILLILGGLIMLLLEIKVTSYGMLTVGGIAALVLGSLLLFDADDPFGSLPLRVILPAVLVTVFFFLGIVGLGLAAQRRRPFSGRDSLAGQMGEVATAEGLREGLHIGRVHVAGELWWYQADQELQPGERVRIQGTDRDVLIVASLRKTDRDGLRLSGANPEGGS